MLNNVVLRLLLALLLALWGWIPLTAAVPNPELSRSLPVIGVVTTLLSGGTDQQAVGGGGDETDEVLDDEVVDETGVATDGSGSDEEVIDDDFGEESLGGAASEGPSGSGVGGVYGDSVGEGGGGGGGGGASTGDDSAPEETDGGVAGTYGGSVGDGGSNDDQTGGGSSDVVDCADFDTQAEAQNELNSDPDDPNHLDSNENGVACEDHFDTGGDDTSSGNGNDCECPGDDVEATDNGGDTAGGEETPTPEAPVQPAADEPVAPAPLVGFRLDDPVLQWLPELNNASAQTGVSVELLAGLMRTTSKGQAGIWTADGRVGLMAVEESALRRLRIAEEVRTDPQLNTLSAAQILAQIGVRGGTYETALTRFFGSFCDAFGSCTRDYVAATLQWSDYYATLFADPALGGLGALPDGFVPGVTGIYQVASLGPLEFPPTATAEQTDAVATIEPTEPTQPAVVEPGATEPPLLEPAPTEEAGDGRHRARPNRSRRDEQTTPEAGA